MTSIADIHRFLQEHTINQHGVCDNSCCVYNIPVRGQGVCQPSSEEENKDAFTCGAHCGTVTFTLCVVFYCTSQLCDHYCLSNHNFF